MEEGRVRHYLSFRRLLVESGDPVCIDWGRRKIEKTQKKFFFFTSLPTNCKK